MVHQDTTEDEPIVTHFGHLVDDDPSLEALRTLRRGDLFLRRPGYLGVAGQEWRRLQFSSDRDYDELMGPLTS